MSKSELACFLGHIDYFEKHIQVCLDAFWCFPRYPMLYSICAVALSLHPIHICAVTYTEHNPGCLVTLITAWIYLTFWHRYVEV